MIHAVQKQNFIERRKKLAAKTSQPLIVITGSDLVQKTSDETYEFEQDGYFYYLTGITEPGWLLVMDIVKGVEFLISTDESSYHSSVWDVKFSPEEIAQISGISDIRTRTDGWAYLKYEISNYPNIGTLVPPARYLKALGMFVNPAKIMLVERLKRAHKDANLVDVGNDIRELRSVKEPGEIEMIQQAIAITKQGFDFVAKKLNSYTSEAEIYTDLMYEFMKRGSDFGYKPVIASEKNATILHYKANSAPLVADSLLLMDVGALAGRYMADITRTYSVGKPSQRHKDVYDAVRSAQQESFNFLKPGVTMRDHEMHMEGIIGKALKELGVIDNMLRKTIREYYPHAISHHLGIDVHDSCDYDLPLSPGAVITVEPGIYLPNECIGVRIEDNILITDTGIDVLSKEIAQ